MRYKRELPIKHCEDCGTHFYAPPKEHADGEHGGESIEFVRGSYKKAERADSGVVRTW